MMLSKILVSLALILTSFLQNTFADSESINIDAGLTDEAQVATAYAQFQTDPELHNLLSKIQLDLTQMTSVLDQLHSHSLDEGGWTPPDEDWQAAIERMKAEIELLKEQVAVLSSSTSGDVDTLKEQMAAINDKIISMTQTMDNMIREVKEEFKEKVEDLADLVQSVTQDVNAISDKITALDNKVENNFLKNLVSNILRTPDRPTVNLFRTTEYRAGDPSKVLPSIVSLTYVCPTSGIHCFKQLLTFLDILDDDPVQYIIGMESLYRAIVDNSDLHDSSRVFVFAHFLQEKRSSILGSGNTEAISRMKNLEKSYPTTVHELVTSSANNKHLRLCGKYLNVDSNRMEECNWEMYWFVINCGLNQGSRNPYTSKVYDFQGDNFETVRLMIWLVDYEEQEYLEPYGYFTTKFNFVEPEITNKTARFYVTYKRGNAVNIAVNHFESGELMNLAVGDDIRNLESLPDQRFTDFYVRE